MFKTCLPSGDQQAGFYSKFLQPIKYYSIKRGKLEECSRSRSHSVGG